MKTIKFAIIGLTLMLSGCVAATGPKLVPLEIQNLQTRSFENELDVVFPSVISVFQDLGYTIKSADKYTGLITAVSTAVSDEATKFWLGTTHISQTSATAFIEEIGKTTRVRISFVAITKKSNYYGRSDENEVPVYIAEVYVNAFDRIDNAIFVRSVD